MLEVIIILYGAILHTCGAIAHTYGAKSHCTKTSVESLCRAEFQDSEVMQFTGHRNVSSLNAYKKPCLQQQRKTSETLSAMYSRGGRPEEIQKQPTVIKSIALSGVFSGSHLDGCTLNFNMYTVRSNFKHNALPSAQGKETSIHYRIRF